MATADTLSALAPAGLKTYRNTRYHGDGLGVSLGQFGRDDQDAIRRVYWSVKAFWDLWRSAGQPGDPVLAEAARALGDASFVSAVRGLGSSLAGAEGQSDLTRKVLHDIRGGALAALIGTAGWVASDARPDASLWATCGFLARDHCKIMRNALPDLDPQQRRADEQARFHGVAEFVRKWDGAVFQEGAVSAAVSVRCDYEGGVACCCLENAAVDRVLYNLINNAARFAADGRVSLAILGVPEGLIRWVVGNAVTPDQRAWLEAQGGSALRDLFLRGVTRGGTGLGLASCADFVAAGFGLPDAAEAVERGYLGARLADGEFLAWFHWPAYDPAAADGPAGW